MLRHTVPRGAHGAKAMRLVHHQYCTVFLLYFDEPRNIRKIPIHTVDTLDGDQDASVLAPDLTEHPIESFKVIVRKGRRRAPERSAPCTILL